MLMKKVNPIKDKSFAFAAQVVNAYEFLTTGHNGYVMSKQLLRSGTAIGALYELPSIDH